MSIKNVAGSRKINSGLTKFISGIIARCSSIGSAEVVEFPEVPSSIYYGKVGVLDIPEVKIDSETYSVSLELTNPTDLSFRLISAEVVE